MSTAVFCLLSQLVTSHLPQSSNACHCSSLSLALLLQFILIGGRIFSADISSFLTSSSWGVHQSRTTPYFPAGNGQTERFNDILWKTVQCLMKDRHLPGPSWPSVLSEALHCIRSLISTAMDASPHNLFLRFERNFRPLPSTVTLHTSNYAWLC